MPRARAARWGVLTAALLWLPPVFADDPCPRTSRGLEWSPACFETTPGGRRVKRAYLGKLVPEREGGTTVMIDSPSGIPELVAIDRRGRVTVPNIYFVGDFDYPDTDRGAPGRFGAGTRKCGYFDVRRLKIVVPASYDHCRAFHDDEAEVCVDCEFYCTDGDCHMSVFVGGRGFVLDRRGRVLRSFEPPDLDTVCGRGRLQSVSRGPGVGQLRCEAAGGGPLDPRAQ